MSHARSRDIARQVLRPRNVRIARELGLWRPTEPTAEGAKQLRDLLESLGTTFIKLGQLLATRGDLIGALYADELSSLQDNVAPLSSTKIENVVIEAFGDHPSSLFAHFDPLPLASASMAQTHRVTLHSGESGVLKVQRPHIAQQVHEDLEILRKMALRLEKRASLARFIQVRGLVDELSHNLRQELDFRQEAANLKQMCESLADFENIKVPRVLGWVHQKVLVMEHVPGVRIEKADLAKLGQADDSASSGKHPAPTREDLARDLLRCYLRQITVDGTYHADPHGGNILLTDDGRIALLDFGLLGRIDDSTRTEVALLLMAIGENRGKDVSDMLLRMSSTSRSSDEQVFAREIRRLLPQYQGELGQMSVSGAIISIQRLAIDCGVALPLPFALIGKTLSQVEGIARAVAPEVDPMQIIRDYTPQLIAAQLQRQMSMGSAVEGLALPLMAAWRIPQRLEHLLAKAEKGEVKIGIVPTELDEAVDELRTITNRIAWAIVASAMIIASALLMNVQGVGEIFGYPALGFIGFVLAFSFGTLLLWRMIRTRGGL